MLESNSIAQKSFVLEAYFKMTLKKKIGVVMVSAVMLVSLTACGGRNKPKNPKGSYSIALETDVGGIDDKSFNQSAWEGLEKWGGENGLVKGTHGYNYYHSTNNSEFATNMNQSINDGFNLLIGVGFRFTPVINEIAPMNEKTDFILIDDKLEGHDNVASVLFKDNESAYLAGVSAAMTTKTKKVGFIGGQESETISRYEDGFLAGVKSISDDIKVSVQYVGSFGDAPKAKAQASAMYASGTDVIYHAAGDSGNGVFSEAIDRMNAGSDEKLWVIGVDKDQQDDGKYADGSVTLISTLKRVDTVVQDLAKKGQSNKFPGGEVLSYGLQEGGVSLSEGQVSPKVKAAIKDAKENIIAGRIKMS